MYIDKNFLHQKCILTKMTYLMENSKVTAMYFMQQSLQNYLKFSKEFYGNQIYLVENNVIVTSRIE